MKGAPFFIVGCGRSGTTALGELLGSHPSVTYLNEPRNLWKNDPRTDVWSKEGAEHGSLDLYEVDEDLRPKLRNALFKRAGKDDLLVEKTPVNSFRIDYLRALFPKARFIHLLRNGIDVARSIQTWVESGRLWYGEDDLKWRLLVDYAEKQGLGELAAESADDPRLRGLLEWRLAVTHVRERLTGSDIELRYEDLVADPRNEIDKLLGWMGLEAGALDAEVLSRPPSGPSELDKDAEKVAGELLVGLGYARKT